MKHLGPGSRPRLHLGVLPITHRPAEAGAHAASRAYHGTRLSLLSRSASPQRDCRRPGRPEARHRRGLAELGPAVPRGARVLLQPRRAHVARRRRAGRAGPASQRSVGLPEGGTSEHGSHHRQRGLRAATLTTGEDTTSLREARRETDAGAGAPSLPPASGGSIELLSSHLRYHDVTTRAGHTPGLPACPAGAAPLSPTSPRTYQDVMKLRLDDCTRAGTIRSRSHLHSGGSGIVI